MGLILSAGSKVSVPLPPHSAYPQTVDPTVEYQADVLTAALTTNYFPELRRQHLTMIQRNLDTWSSH